MNAVREQLKTWLAAAVMRLPRFRKPGTWGPGARIVVYHETPPMAMNRFRRHLDYFSQNYRVVSLDQLTEALQRGQSVDGSLAITFDDGFKDNLECAVPLLQEKGMSACFFVVTQFLSAGFQESMECRTLMRNRFRRKGLLHLMKWDDLRWLLGKGFSIGSHTRTHPDLTPLSPEEANDEITGSRDDLAEHLGRSPVHFAWPFGELRYFNGTLGQRVRSAGYATCSSAERGFNKDRTCLCGLKRDHLTADAPPEMVRFFLEGGYDWVRKKGIVFGRETKRGKVYEDKACVRA